MKKNRNDNETNDTYKASERDLLLLISQAANIINSVVDDFYKQYKITRVQFRALYILFSYDKEGISLSELSEKLNVSKPNVTTLIERMVKKGFVERKSTDRRSINAVITKEGQKILKSILPKDNELSSSLLNFLDENEKSNLYNLISKLIRTIDSKPKE